MLEPPRVVNVRDRHGGCTVETQVSRRTGDGPHHIGNTLWLHQDKFKDAVGVLIEGTVNHKTFYQMHEDVTSAKYKVNGLRWPVVLWWDNVTGERYA